MKTTNKPLASAPLLSYRYRGRFGWIMIGATCDQDAMHEAARSTDNVTIDRLEKYEGGSIGYLPVRRG